MSVPATLTLAPGCSPWRLRSALAARRLSSRTVAAGPTYGTQVSTLIVVFEYVITVPGYPRRVEGRQAVAGLYRPYGATFSLDRCYDLAVHHDQATGVVVLDYASQGRAIPTGTAYSNRYISVLSIVDRKIAHWRDYLDPLGVLARECRDHLPGALEDPLVQLALDDCPQDRFLAFGVGRVGHLAGPHPGDRATQVRVGVAAPEHGDHLDRLNASAAAGGGVALLGPGQLPVCVGSAIAIVASPVVDRATAAQEGHVRLLEDPPHHGIKQAHGVAEYLDAFGPLAGAFVGPGAKIAEMAEDVRRPGREILGHAPIMPPALAAVAGRGGVQAGGAANNRAAR